MVNWEFVFKIEFQTAHYIFNTLDIFMIKTTLSMNALYVYSIKHTVGALLSRHHDQRQMRAALLARQRLSVAVSGMPQKFYYVAANNSPPSPPPKPIRTQSTISHQPREFPLCLMQISHVLFLFISFYYLGSGKCHVGGLCALFVKGIIQQGSLSPPKHNAQVGTAPCLLLQRNG